jgi:hypothetical protein
VRLILWAILGRLCWLSIALVTYNVLSVVKAALRSVHGTEKIETEISYYYLADEIQGTYRGKRNCDSSTGVVYLPRHELYPIVRSPQISGRSCQVKCFSPSSSRSQEGQAKRNFLKQQPHVSTAKLLAQAKGKQTP